MSLPISNPRPSRLPAIDAVRAAAMLLGVLLHAAAPYMHLPLRGLIMPLQEPASSRLPDTIFWILHAFRVPMFFVVAGFFARDSLARKGPDAFLKSRWKRIALPLLIAYPIITIVIHPIWLWGWVTRGWASWGHLFSLKFGPELERAVWGLHHLWFLEYLFLYSIVLWGAARLTRRDPSPPTRPANARVVRAADVSLGQQSETFTPAPKPTPRVWRLWLLILLVIALGTWIFSVDASWYLDFHDVYVPERLPLAYNALFFAMGLLLRREWLRLIALLSPVFLLFAAGCLWPMLNLIAGSVWQTDHGPRQGRLSDIASDRLVLGTLVTAIAAFASLGLIGLASLLCSHATRLGGFLVDSAYWVFLTHLPWVGLAVMLQRAVPIAPELKMCIAAALAGAMSLVTFIPIRSTKLGRWLGATAPAPGCSP